jgi:hypothetical protein
MEAVLDCFTWWAKAGAAMHTPAITIKTAQIERRIKVSKETDALREEDKSSLTLADGGYLVTEVMGRAGTLQNKKPLPKQGLGLRVHNLAKR